MHEQLRSIIVLRIKFPEKQSSNEQRRKSLEEAHICAKQKRICNRLDEEDDCNRFDGKDGWQ